MISSEIYEKFLMDMGYYPLDKWNWFEAEHHIEMKKGIKNSHTIKIRNQGKNISGVYVYFDMDCCLYVGESSNLGGRFKDHYNESWRENTKYKQYDFFKQYKKTLYVKWIEVNNVFDRKIIEAMLVRILNPLYEDFKKHGNSIF